MPVLGAAVVRFGTWWYGSCMRRTRDDFDRLISELDWDAQQLGGLLATNARAHERLLAGAADELAQGTFGADAVVHPRPSSRFLH